jgi:hypothetical protein
MRRFGVGVALLLAMGVGGVPQSRGADVLPLPTDSFGQSSADGVRQVRFNYYDEEEADDAEEAAPAPAAATCESCGDGCCDVCYTACKSCGPCWTCRSGVEATFLSPQINGNPGFVGIADLVNPFVVNAYEIDSDAAAADNFYVAPRLWLGFQKGCWGIVARHWQLRAAESFSDPLLGVVAGDPTGAYASEKVNMYLTDVEVNRSFVRNCWKLDGSFGVRHGSLDVESIVTATDPVAGGELFSGSALTSRQFNGTGLTFGLQGRRPVRCGSSLNYFWNARGSVLWGEHDATAAASTSVIGAGGAAANTTFATASSDTEMWIAELQAGLEWDYALRCLPANAFFRVAAEYQYWDVADGAFATVDSFAIAPTAEAFATATAGDISMNLVGFSIGTGFTW